MDRLIIDLEGLSDFLPMTQAAAKLGVSYQTLRKRLISHRRPVYKLGNLHVVRVSDLRGLDQPA